MSNRSIKHQRKLKRSMTLKGWRGCRKFRSGNYSRRGRGRKKASQ